MPAADPHRPAIAVIVVAYNSEHDLPATLEALRPQLRDDDEVVVVDNASAADQAPAVHSVLPEARIERLSRNLGFAGGVNAGVAASSAPLIFLLNPDAVVEPGAVDLLRATAADRPDWGAWQALVLLPDGVQVNAAGGTLHFLGLGWAGGMGLTRADVGTELVEVGFASGAALLVRRSAWERVGGFDPDYFMYGEDLDLSLRLRLAGYGVGLQPRAGVLHDYTFTKGDYKWFHLERNRAWTVLATYPGALLLPLLPALLALELALLPVAALGGWLPAKLRAQAAVVKSLPRALRRRTEVQRLRTVPVARFTAGFSSSLDSPFLGPAAKVLPLVWAQAAYWTLVRAIASRRADA